MSAVRILTPRRLLLALLVTVLCGASCVLTLAPRQYPGTTAAPECPAPLLTVLHKPDSVILVVTQCLLSSDPYEQVRDWYHTQAIGPTGQVPGFPAWTWGPIRFSVYATLELPPLAQLEGSASTRGSRAAVMTQTSYTLSRH